MPQKDRYNSQRDKVKSPMFGLADVRKSHGMTQADVAAKVAAITDEPFNSGSLSLIEGGHRGASAAVLAALAQVFGMADGAAQVEYEPSHSRRKLAPLKEPA